VGRHYPERPAALRRRRAARLRARWHQVQIGFVDEPRHAVEVADALVIMVEKGVAERFAEDCQAHKQWTPAGYTSSGHPVQSEPALHGGPSPARLGLEREH
jgi:hypothetical protein